MFGAMQDWKLRVSGILDYAAKYHARRPVQGRSAEGVWTESNWAQVRAGEGKHPPQRGATGRRGAPGAAAEIRLRVSATCVN